MSSAAEVLVIILSIVLAIFLIVGIILAVFLIRLTKQIRQVTESANHTVENIGLAVSSVTRIATPMFIARIVAKQIRRFRKGK